MAAKIKYAGKFNINHEVLEESAEAYTAEQAKYWMAHQLALRCGVIPQAIWGYWKAHPNSFEIKRQVRKEHFYGESYR